MKDSLKLCLWTSIPSHYQRALVRALSTQCDLKVMYFEQVREDRIALGWEARPAMLPFERYVSTLDSALDVMPDWRDRIHIVSGYGGTFQRSLGLHLVRHRAMWVDWSEPSTPGWRWYCRYPIKRWWSYLVSKYALGSLAIGRLAEDDFVRRGALRSRVAYLPYVSDIHRDRPAADGQITAFSAGRRVFLFLGTLCHRKGIDILLEASGEVLQRASSWTLVFVGNDDSGGAYQRLAGKLGIGSQVLFRGAVDPNQIGSVVSSSDVLILPSRHDGWGVAINEGVAGALPIIASHKCGAAWHLVSQGVNGYRFESGSVPDLANAMTRYIKNPELLDQHGRRSLAIAQDIDPDANAYRLVLTLRQWAGERDANKSRSLEVLNA